MVAATQDVSRSRNPFPIRLNANTPHPPAGAFVLPFAVALSRTRPLPYNEISLQGLSAGRFCAGCISENASNTDRFDVEQSEKAD
jgi:hypothetical protein